MSAFMVSDHHINVLVSYALAHKVQYTWQRLTFRCLSEEDAQQWANKLYMANAQSMFARYGDREPLPTEPFVFKRASLLPVTPLVIVKACQCFDYQACEVDNYETTEAAAMTTAILKKACSNLPGWDKAPWGL